MESENDGLNGDHTLREADEPDSSPALITIPQTPAEFKPPRVGDLITTLAELCRQPEYWERIKGAFEAEAGLRPFKHGRREFHWAEVCFDIQKVAAENGHPNLDDVTANLIFMKLRRSYTRNTGVRMGQLTSQRHRLLLEHKAAAE